MFFAGAAFNYIPLHKRHWVIPPMLVGFVIACTGSTLAVVQGGVFLCLPGAVFLLAYWLPLTRIRLRHDLSYGIYIYAFPVQQAITEISLRHGISKPLYLTTALGIVVMLAFASWVLIERPAIAWSQSLVTSFRRRKTACSPS